MNHLRSLTAGALIVGLFAGGAAFAQGGRDGDLGGRAGGRGPMGGPGLMLRGLNLTETQQQQVREIREQHREAVQKASQRVREAMQAQRKAIQAIPLNEGEIRATTFALAEAQTEEAVQQARIQSEIWSVLTAAQQEDVRKRQAEREARQPRNNPQRGGR